MMTGVAFAQYKMEPIGAPPSDLATAIASNMQQSGYKVVAPNGSTFCEVWFRNTMPSGPKSTEDAVAFATIPHGALLGVIRFPGQGADRRGQSIKPGIYTLRYSLYPVNGDHQGVAPQRDFLVLSPAAVDKDPAALPKFDELMDMSRKASGTPHPAVLGIESATGDKFPGFGKEGEHDWVLSVKLGEQPIAVILVGKSES
jgi:hypothetical protein